MVEIRPVFKFWLETEKGYVFGEGPFELLCKVKEHGTISDAARELGMSYRHAWGVIKDVEEKMSAPLLKTFKGGISGGGGAELTKEAQNLIEQYFRLKEAYTHASSRLAIGTIETMLGLSGHLQGSVLNVTQSGNVSLIRIRIEKGETFEVLADSTDLQRKHIELGNRVQVEIKDATMALRKI